MQHSHIAHTLREQFHDFTQTLASRLSKLMGRFLQEMVYGISAYGDVKLSNIGRALQETNPLQKTEESLSRNLQQKGLGQLLNQEIARAGVRRIHADTLLIIDPNRNSHFYSHRRIWTLLSLLQFS